MRVGRAAVRVAALEAARATESMAAAVVVMEKVEREAMTAPMAVAAGTLRVAVGGGTMAMVVVELQSRHNRHRQTSQIKSSSCHRGRCLQQRRPQEPMDGHCYQYRPHGALAAARPLGLRLTRAMRGCQRTRAMLGLCAGSGVGRHARPLPRSRLQWAEVGAEEALKMAACRQWLRATPCRCF